MDSYMRDNNDSDTNNPHQLLIRFHLYTIFGAAAIVTNVIVIVIFATAKDLRQRFLLFIMLAIADCVNGISYVVSGLGRARLIHDGKFYTTISQSDCMMTMSWPALLIVAGQLPAATTLVMAIERIIAVKYPLYFKIKWTSTSKAQLISIAWLSSIAGFTAAVLTSLYGQGVNSTRMCSVMDTVGTVFGTIHFSLISLAFLGSFISLIAVFFKTRNNKVASRDDLRRQKLLLYVTGFSVLLVAFPHSVLIFDDWKLIRVSDLFIGISYCSFAASSIINIFVYGWFRPEFRRQMVRLLTLRLNDDENSPLSSHDDVVKNSAGGRQRNGDDARILLSSQK